MVSDVMFQSRQCIAKHSHKSHIRFGPLRTAAEIFTNVKISLDAFVRFADVVAYMVLKVDHGYKE